MTPSEVQQYLLEAGFFTVRHDRHLLGCTGWPRPGVARHTLVPFGRDKLEQPTPVEKIEGPGSLVLDLTKEKGIPFRLTLVDRGLYLGAVGIGVPWTQTGSPKKICSYVISKLLETREPFDVQLNRSEEEDLWALVKFGQNHPEAKSESQMLGAIHLQGLDPSIRTLLDELYKPKYCKEITEEELLKLPLVDPPLIVGTQEHLEGKYQKSLGEILKNRLKPWGVCPDSRPSGPLTERSFYWYPLEYKDSWEGGLLRDDWGEPIRSLTTQVLDPATLISYLRRLLGRHENPGLDLLLFATPLDESSIAVCVAYQRGDIRNAPERPMWLVELLKKWPVSRREAESND